MKLSRSFYILLINLLVSFSFLHAQYNNIEFVENKGQWDDKIKYAGKINGGAFYVEHNGFQVLQHNLDDWKKLTDAIHSHAERSKVFSAFTLRSHSYQVQFVNAKENPEIIPDKPQPGYNNYFIGNDPTKWAGGCKIFQGVTMKNIYPNVD